MALQRSMQITDTIMSKGQFSETDLPISLHNLTCNMLSGSFNVTGMDIFVRSLPMFRYSRFHMLTSGDSGFGTGRRVLRPVAQIGCGGASESGTKMWTAKFVYNIIQRVRCHNFINVNIITYFLPTKW